MTQPKTIDFKRTKTFSAKNRYNLVRIDNLRTPGAQDDNLFNSEEFDILIEKLKKAKKENKSITCFFGAHVIKCGLSRYLIWLMENGYITHLASNGAGSIHDFELAYLGGTSEHVPTAIEDGSFGMWEETGLWMTEAIKAGAKKGLGYGQSLYEYVKSNKQRFPNIDDCVFYRGWDMGIPVTYHTTIGTDIIDQHPNMDFASKGLTSGIDFGYFCQSIADLDGGVHMNIGSAVTGAEVFLKALSIARNQGNPTFNITTANFDIIPLGDYRTDISHDKYDYYYRPRKNVINRPTSQGGTGLYIYGNHEVTIPSLYSRLK
ncbi:MAG: hypothetical protein K6B52_04345 [Clostridiales bacterium]|nr:hypothetical protein [Clostridiales bacterium]